VYRLDKQASEKARLTISPNDVRLGGPTLLALRRGPDGWSARFWARFTVEQGQLDTFKLRVPPTWSGPYKIDANVPVAMELDAAQPARALLIRFSESVAAGEAVEMSIDGALAQAAQSPVSVPAIVPESSLRGKRYLAVPSRLEAQRLAWSETGVRAADLPDAFRQTPDIPSDARTFEVVDKRFRVAIEPPAALQPLAHVRLADTAVSTSVSGAQLIETRLVIAAPGLAHCTLQLPRAGPALAQPVDARRWRVSLGPSQLPQILEIISADRAGANEGRKLERPILLVDGKPISVELSLWSIGYSPASARPRVTEADTVTESVQTAVRLDRLVSIADSAMPAAVEAPRPDGYRWFQLWAGRLATLRDQAVEDKGIAPSGRPRSQVSRAAEEQLARASEQLDQWIEQGRDLFSGPEVDSDQAVDEIELPPRGQSGRSPVRGWIYCVAEGGGQALTVDLGPPAAASTTSRVTGISAVIASAAASVWLLRRPAAADFLYRWPHAMAFLVGVAAWAWLRPSWAGLLIAAASLLLAGRRGWPGRSLPRERSTVLRIPRSDVVVP
jgi:hypothetical protein